MRLHEIMGMGFCVLLINVSQACKREKSVSFGISNMTKLFERPLQSTSLDHHFSFSLSHSVFAVFTKSDTVDMTPGKDWKKKKNPLLVPDCKPLIKKCWFQGPPETSELYPSWVLTSLLLGLWVFRHFPAGWNVSPFSRTSVWKTSFQNGTYQWGRTAIQQIHNT